MKDVFRFSFYTFALLLIAILLPLGGGIFYFFSYLPLMYLALKRGPIEAFFSLLLVLAALFLTAAPLFAVAYGVFCGGLIIPASRGIRKGIPAGGLILGGSALFCLSGIIVFIFLERFADNALTAGMAGIIDTIGRQARLAGVKAEAIPAFTDFFTEAMFGIMFLSVMVSMGVTYKVGERLYARGGIMLPALNLTAWRPPEIMVWGLISGGYFYWLSFRMGSLVMKLAGLNLGIIFLGIYFFSGLSLAGYYFGVYKISVWLRILGFLILLWQPLVVAGLGVADVWVDFRKMKKGGAG